MDSPVFWFVLHLFGGVGELIELHISASITAAALHWPGLLILLDRSLPALWVLAVLFAGVLALLRSLGGATAADPVTASAVILGFVTIPVLYAVAAGASRRAFAPDVVLQRMRRRAMVYPVVFVVTVSPSAVVMLGVSPWCSWLGSLAIGLSTSKGTFNAIAFFALSPMPASQSQPHAVREVEMREAPGGARVVGFDTTVVLGDAASGSGSWRRPFQWRGTSVILEAELDEARRASGDARNGEASGDDLDSTMWRAYVGSEAW